MSDWLVTTDVYGCELWQGALWPSGHPLFEHQSAHRVAYERAHGAIPDGLVLDHLCRRRRCVAIEHIEAVSKSENEKRKSMKYRLARKKCRRGHVLTEATRVVTPEMGVLCRQCMKEQR